MKILVTGSNGFVGKNLISTLQEIPGIELYLFDRKDSIEKLDVYTKSCDFVVHLAGVNRPKDDQEFLRGNRDLTETLCNYLIKNESNAPVLISSSIKVTEDSEYGKSKLMAEKALLDLNRNHGNRVYIYRLPNLFGKWSRPFYNSVVATWCYQIARGEEIRIDDPQAMIELVYIDDFVKDIIACINNEKEYQENHYYSVDTSYPVTLSQLATTINLFSSSRENLNIPDLSDELTKKLYSTYLYFLPQDDFSYPLMMNVDERGSFTEFIKSPSAGQVSVNVSKPGIIKGNHWHHSKHEKFLVVKGEAIIKFREIFSDEIIEYHVSGTDLKVVDIPTGYTHSIINIGTEELVTVMWVNESYDPSNPDTYFKEV